ncbi:MAG: hypothetical protein HOC71_15280 [Candidatus Latescibacteria bacterium]|jgi:hypothetical protein|nr:hypothetical protein [Candidatus Latescibacterota bacterium]
MFDKKSYILLILLLLLTFGNSYAEENIPSIKPYGFIKVDMAIDETRTNSGNYVFNVKLPDQAHGKDGEFNMTARQTRLGANLLYDEIKDRIISARFEFDFFGGGAENKNLPMLRHAFFKVDLGKYYLLAGQTSDIISPLVPSTVNYTVLWNCGNIGYRHPQFQFGNIVTNGVEIVGSLSRNISGDIDDDGNDDGEDSSLPVVQGRLSYINPEVNIGVSGHYGKMEYRNGLPKDKHYTTYSVNLHASYILTHALSIKGEAFTGKTLNQYFGGIGQGFNYQLEKEVESTGGWINAALKAHNNITCNLGIGIDQPQKHNKLSFPSINLNKCMFANIYTNVAHNTSFAIEISKWTTGYYDNAGNDLNISNLRVQTAFILNI